jgi:hypothetical protein
MVFFAFSNPKLSQSSPGSITLYLNAAGLWSGTLYRPAGTFDHMTTAADHEAAIQLFAPPGFPAEWVPLMAQQMVDAPQARWVAVSVRW